MKPIRVLLVEDHVIAQAGILGLLQNVTGIIVVGEASDGRGALALTESRRSGVLPSPLRRLPDTPGNAPAADYAIQGG